MNTIPKVKTRTAEMISEHITEFLASGGLFNPELMDHEEVRDLLIECRETILNDKTRLEQMARALEPFASESGSFDEYSEASAGVLQPSFCDHTIGDLRRARASLDAYQAAK